MAPLAPALIDESYYEDELAEGNSRVTVFHAIEDAPAVDILAGGSPVIEFLAFPGTQGNNDGASTIDVPGDTYDLAVVPAGTTEPVVIDGTGFEIAPDSFYFIAAVGTLESPSVAVASIALADLHSDMAMDDEMMDEDMAEGDEEMSEGDEDMAEGDDEMMEEMGTIVDIAAGNEDFATLVAAVQAAGLVDTLNGEGPFTVFAPTNDAFAAALEALGLEAADLLADTETLTSILTYHVIAGEVLAETVVTLDGQSAATVQGEELGISIVDGGVVLNDAVNVVATDILASNGVIHVIDGVLLPPSFGN